MFSHSFPIAGSSSGGGHDVARSPHGVGMNDFDLLKVLGTGGDFLLYLYHIWVIDIIFVYEN